MILKRETNLATLLETMLPFMPLEGFDPGEWLALRLNVALTDSEGNYALFERYSEHVVTGHYFYKTARGKRAVELSKLFLHEAFTGPYNIETIRGLTPLDKLGARWLSKQIGFTSYGDVQTKAGPCELVILNKQEWENI